MVVGDFNGDGYTDLAVANADSNSVSLLLGGGDGSFKQPANLPVGTEPRALAAGDFNGDRFPDLVAVGSVFEFNVAVLLGGAGGAFTGPTYFDAGEAPVSVAVGDFNRDGNQDLADVNANFVTVSVLLGVGDGTFSAPTDFATGPAPFAVAVDDFNGDGNPDVAVANDTGSSTSSNTVSVLLGGAGGSFTGPTTYRAGLTPLGVAVGDFNGDFSADLAGANEDSANVSVLLANLAPYAIGDSSRTARATALRGGTGGVGKRRRPQRRRGDRCTGHRAAQRHRRAER